MFNTRQKLRRYHAALCRYEDQLMRKDHLLQESEDLLSYMRKRLSISEECSETLAAENKRLAENADLDQDLYEEMWSEYRNMMHSFQDQKRLEEENYRLWVENALLRGELAKLNPRKAAEISRGR